MSILTCTRACRRACLRTAAIVALCALATSSFAQSPAPTLQQQRDAFRAAYTAAQAGRDWRPLAKGLQDYPLYPYLEAAALRQDLKTASAVEIDAYLQRYPGLIPADDLRKAELRWLAKQKDWTGF
ncbi:MAG TPA: hypothetical protein VFP92_07510, partial [Rhodanobacteraceae bacterium]|nr:hypothetical protein [Rhodanobacteraceae bacterium]